MRRMPLMAKLLTLAILPILFAAYLTWQLYSHKMENVQQIKIYLEQIDQTATVSRLIDQLQIERRYSFDFVLRQIGQKEMITQRAVTDSLLAKLERDKGQSLKGFLKYAFIDNIDSVRNRIDRKAFTHNAVMHFYSSAAFRFASFNRRPWFGNEFLLSIYDDLTMQKLLSEIVTYQGIISANIYHVLYSRQFVAETLFGTLPSYDIYKTYEREIFEKASPTSAEAYRALKEGSSTKQVQSYLNTVFTSFKIDSTYDFETWRNLSLASLNQLRGQQMKYLDRAENRINEYYQTEITKRNWTLILLLLFTVLIITVATFILVSINRSLRELSLGAIRLSEGRSNINVIAASKDAIGSLATSICQIDEKNKELSLAAQNIGRGNFQTLIQPRSEEDQLGNAIVSMRDELLQYTNALQESKEEFEKLADFVPQIVWTADGFGKVTYYNRKWYEVTGAKDGFSDQNWVQVLHPDDVGSTLTAWYESVQTGVAYELEYRIKDVGKGEYRWFLGRAVPVTNAEHEIVKWFGTATDIHDQKIQKEKLEELVAQRTLELNRSNEDLQQFAHVASHDLKEPLRKISTFSDRMLVEFGNFLPEKGRIYLQKLLTSSKRMSQMIDSILNYSVVNASEKGKEVVDLNLVLNDITNDLDLLILQKDAKIIYNNLPALNGTPTLLYQLFYNLINNALKFTKADVAPIITIRAKKQAATELTDVVDGKKYSHYIHVTVEDNGIGFHQEYANSMFNIFTRLHARETYEGTGLGLALCRRIVHRHHGVIYAEGKENAGATFHIVLPAGG